MRLFQQRQKICGAANEGRRKEKDACTSVLYLLCALFVYCLPPHNGKDFRKLAAYEYIASMVFYIRTQDVVRAQMGEVGGVFPRPVIAMEGEQVKGSVQYMQDEFMRSGVVSKTTVLFYFLILW